jgi:stage V sporulation protein S
MDIAFNNFELENIKPEPMYPADLEPAVEVPAAPRPRVATEDANLVAEILKVSSRSRPSAVAGAIAGVIRGSGRAEVQAIGAGATNQAVKAVAIARDYLATNGLDIVCVPAFIDVVIGDEDRTAIRLIVEPR